MSTPELHLGDLVPSLSIEAFLNSRAAILERLRQLAAIVIETQEIATRSGLGMPAVSLSASNNFNAEKRINGSYKDERFDCAHFCEREVDRCGWQYLMNQSGMRTLMDAKARAEWDKSLSDGKFPELTRENIEATFERLHASRGELFERGVLECFKHLNWCYKTNQPSGFGKRIILKYVMSVYTFKDGRMSHLRHEATNKLDDLVRVMSILDGKPEPDHRSGCYHLISQAQKDNKQEAEHEYFTVRWFLNGNGHLTFKRPDLVEKMNQILTKHYPGALPHDRHTGNRGRRSTSSRQCL